MFYCDYFQFWAQWRSPNRRRELSWICGYSELHLAEFSTNLSCVLNSLFALNGGEWKRRIFAIGYSDSSQQIFSLFFVLNVSNSDRIEFTFTFLLLYLIGRWIVDWPVLEHNRYDFDSQSKLLNTENLCAIDRSLMFRSPVQLSLVSCAFRWCTIREPLSLCRDLDAPSVKHPESPSVAYTRGNEKTVTRSHLITRIESKVVAN